MKCRMRVLASALVCSIPFIMMTPVVAPASEAEQAVEAAKSFVAEDAVPEKKRTKLGLYVTAAEAYARWAAAPDKVRILDCRTPEEYVFVGHAPMALNIPKQFMERKLKADGKGPEMRDNPDFIAMLKKAFKLDDTIFAMCRSGGRSANTVNLLADAGFTKVYNVIDGFEGDMIKDPESCFDGKRMRNGWKNCGAPWTYDLDPALVFHVVSGE